MYQLCERCQVMSAVKAYERCWSCGEPWTHTYDKVEDAYKKVPRRYAKPVTVTV